MSRCIAVVRVLIALTALSVPGIVSAQVSAGPHRARVVEVTFLDGGPPEQGRLVQLARQAVILDIGGERQRFALGDVARIVEERDDSIVNGAVIGALVAGGVCALTCREEADTEAYRRLGIGVIAGFGALVGAGVDLAHPTRTTIYPRSPQSRPGRSAHFGWRVRF